VSVEEIIEDDGKTVVIQMTDKNGKKHETKHVIKNRHVVVNKSGQKLSKEEMKEIMVEVREGLAEVDEVLAETDVIVAEALAEAGQQGTVVKMECTNDSDEVSTVIENQNGRTVLICQSRIMAQALSGLEEARKAIANNPEMPSEMRDEVLETLDEQIERWRERSS